MKFTNFSPKQRKLLGWWIPGNPDSKCDAIICDGAIRSGKTLCMSISFVFWTLFAFNGAVFVLAGKTIMSLRRNLILPLIPFLKSIGFEIKERISENWIEISDGKHRNRYYLFGGKDEGSAALIQGMTLGGVLFDEAALMPRSFVEQSLARCSLPGSRFWFNCNPESPGHWFYKEWLEEGKPDDKNALHLHFTMDDNPSLTPEIRQRYENLYSGVFYERFILGRWVVAEGLIYPAQAAGQGIVPTVERKYTRYIVSVDYGTINPFSLGLWGFSSGVWYRIREFYYDSRKTGVQLTDEEHYSKLTEFLEGLPVEQIVLDPSAASFRALIKRKGRYKVREARNDVIDGIRYTASAFVRGLVAVNDCCKDSIAEFQTYRWDEKAKTDKPLKETDHAMDDIRYFCYSILRRE